MVLMVTAILLSQIRPFSKVIHPTCLKVTKTNSFKHHFWDCLLHIEALKRVVVEVTLQAAGLAFPYTKLFAFLQFELF